MKKIKLMGTIKFEIDLPEFNKEININLTIRKDGEVIYTTSSPFTDVNNSKLVEEKTDFSNKQKNIIVEGSNKNSSESQGILNKTVEPEKPKSSSKRIINGNMMNADI